MDHGEPGSPGSRARGTPRHGAARRARLRAAGEGLLMALAAWSSAAGLLVAGVSVLTTWLRLARGSRPGTPGRG